MSRASRPLLRLRDDRKALRLIRLTWLELRLVRRRTGWQAFCWGNDASKPVATGKTPAELSDRIRASWEASGVPR